MSVAVFAAGAFLGAVIAGTAVAASRHDRERAIDARAYDAGYSDGHTVGWVDGINHEAAAQCRRAHPSKRLDLEAQAYERAN